MNQQLVIVGGGHSHVIALKLWGLNPVPGVDLTLVSDVKHTPYSGMLPGHVAGFYSYEETHIDLENLAKYAGATLIIDRAIGIDTQKKQIICQQQSIKFDYLSLDIGSTPQAVNVPGAEEYAIPAKPVPTFLHAWYKLTQNAVSQPQKPLSIGIVGGGAGGVELALNMQACLKEVLTDQGQQTLEIHLIHRGEKLLLLHNHWVSNKLMQVLKERSIKVHLQQNVTRLESHEIYCQSGLSINCNHVFWVTQAAAPQWIRESDLSTNEKGFILVSNTLQSISHPQIFAAGDIATMANYKRPKAGVFAVRQGKPLVDNWRNILTKKQLKPYIPQQNYLALIGTGDHQAIASRGNWGSRSSIFWWLKDHIDRKFMHQFIDLT